MITEYFPLYGLLLRTPRLELRLSTLDELGQLASVACAGIHPPEEQPFSEPWTDQPPERLGLSVVQHHLQKAAEWTPQSWSLNLAVLYEGEAVGIQDLGARDFAVARQVHTGSWLGRAHQGKGIGTEMRAAVLHLAFAELGAVSAKTALIEGNARSEGVSRRLGYRYDGVDVISNRGRRALERRMRLSREDWDGHRTVEVAVEGLEACRGFFAAEDADTP
ncbi:GNAT family N-acetyltransferase [Nocardiopsis algeriensis]|uniref:GNAT family N-acetyltransferase n=1 Tax=Nocardiopsis algeriensis TaxID=1478215 RepID=UPI003B42BF29